MLTVVVSEYEMMMMMMMMMECCRYVVMMVMTGLLKLHLPMLTMLYIDETFVRPENVLELPLCPSLQHLVYRTLRTPPTNDTH